MTGARRYQTHEPHETSSPLQPSFHIPAGKKNDFIWVFIVFELFLETSSSLSSSMPTSISSSSSSKLSKLWFWRWEEQKTSSWVILNLDLRDVHKLVLVHRSGIVQQVEDETSSAASSCRSCWSCSASSYWYLCSHFQAADIFAPTFRLLSQIFLSKPLVVGFLFVCCFWFGCCLYCWPSPPHTGSDTTKLIWFRLLVC